ncbi:hypothetical protein [Kumtagia ephedrae]|nr:hypothetical protein [Mesorhizobium ephedrae]
MNAEPTPAIVSRDLERIAVRHMQWLDELGIRHKPWLIHGSAPNPTIPAEIAHSHARIDINNAGRTAAALGLGRADLTVRARKKSWEEHPHIDTRGLLWMHTWPPALLRLQLIGKPYDHIGSLMSLKRPERDAIVTHVAGVSVRAVGDLGKVTNGVAMICYAMLMGVPEVVVAGISLSKVGHSYDQQGRPRRQVEEDAFILERLRSRAELFTTEQDLASDAGLKLWNSRSAD